MDSSDNKNIKIKTLFELMLPVTEPRYKKPKKWGVMAAGLTLALCAGLIGGYFYRNYTANKEEKERQNQESVWKQEDYETLIFTYNKRNEYLEKNAKLDEQMKLMDEAEKGLDRIEKNYADAQLALELAKQQKAGLEETVAALKKEIEEKEKKHNDYIQNHPEDLTVEKKTEMSNETAGLRKQLEEKVAELVILQDQIKKNDPSKEISRLTEENKRLHEETNKEKEELTKERNAYVSLKKTAEDIQKSFDALNDDFKKYKQMCEVEISQKDFKELNENLEAARKSIEENKKTRETLEATVTDTKRSLEERTKACAVLETQLTDTKGQLTEVKREFEEFKKNRLEEIAKEAQDSANDSDQEYRERLQKDIELCTRAISSSHDVRDKAIGYNNRGNAKIRLSMYDVAIKDYDEALKLQSDYFEAYNGRGYAKYKRGLFKEALADLDKALQLKPDYVPTLVNRGVVKAELNLLEDAIRDFDRAIQLKPNDAWAYCNKGHAKRKLGRLEEAIQDYDAALKIQPGDPKMEFMRKRAYDEYQEKNAEEVKKKGKEPSASSKNLTKILEEIKGLKPFSIRGWEDQYKDLEKIKETLIDIILDGRINPIINSFSSEKDEVLLLVEQSEHLARMESSIPILSERISQLSCITKDCINILASSDQIKGYAIVITQKQHPGSSVRLFGLYKNDHLALSGTLTEHSKALNITLEDALKRHQGLLGERFGYSPETALDSDEKRREIFDMSVVVPRENWAKLADFFPNGELKNKASERITEGTYKIMLKENEIVAIRLVYVANAARASDLVEKKGEAETIEDILENSETLSKESRDKLLKDIELITKVIDSQSTGLENRAAVYNNRGNMKQRLGLYKEAIDDYNEAIQLRPNYAQAYSNRSVVKQHLGMLEEAIQDCDIAIKFNPSFVGAYFNRGNAKLKLGRLEDAIKDYDKVLELNPDYAMAELNKRRACEQLKEKDPKKNPLENYLAEAERYYGVGTMKFNLSLLTDALAAFNKATEFDPSFADAYHFRSIVKFYLSNISEKGDHAEYELHKQLRKEAIADINAALQLKPDDFAAQNTKACLLYISAHIYDDQKFLEQILQDFDNVIKLKPDCAEACNNRGLMLYIIPESPSFKSKPESKKFELLDSAISSFDKAIELKPDFARAYYMRGIAKNSHRNVNMYKSKYTWQDAEKDQDKAKELGYKHNILDDCFALIIPCLEKK